MRSLEDPRLLPFLPLLYAAWSDGELTTTELDELRADESATEPLAAWLDPAQPATAAELDAMQRLLRAHAGAPDAAAAHRSPGFDPAAMVALLDGRYASARRETREILRTFTRPEALPREAYRARVMEWLAALCAGGLGARAFPPRDERGASKLGEFIAVFETVAGFDLSLVVKLGVQMGLFGGSIYFLGGPAQRALLPRVASLDLLGCFAMSELGHGSNVRDIETVARYDHATRSFEVHTPNDAARKEWIGGAARDARLATVFAQLEVGGEGRGVHAFLVPLRDDAGRVLPGIRIEDCGEKMGLNGVDNGRIWFERVTVPVEAMLDRYASIDAEGRYQSPIEGDSKRFFTTLGTLVGGRVSVAGGGLTAAKSALTVAVRYGERRRQFGPPGGPETLLNDYPTHQRRLMPLVAEAYALHFAHARLVEQYESGEDARRVEALAAGLKAVATWFTTGAIQSCREACGGQGYLAVNQLPALKADTDVFTTFEGDNTVLMQLVAKSLLTDFRAQFGDSRVLGVARHLARRAFTAVSEQNPIATRRTATEHLRGDQFHAAAFRFRESSLLASVAGRLRKRLSRGEEPTAAFNGVQTHLVALARAHVERVVVESAGATVASCEASLRAPLARLVDLYALCRIEDDLAWFLENNYIEPGKARAIRNEVDALCAEVRPDAVALVDAFGIDVSAPIAALETDRNGR